MYSILYTLLFPVIYITPLLCVWGPLNVSPGAYSITYAAILYNIDTPPPVM